MPPQITHTRVNIPGMNKIQHVLLKVLQQSIFSWIRTGAGFLFCLMLAAASGGEYVNHK